MIKLTDQDGRRLLLNPLAITSVRVAISIDREKPTPDGGTHEKTRSIITVGGAVFAAQEPIGIVEKLIEEKILDKEAYKATVREIIKEIEKETKDD